MCVCVGYARIKSTINISNTWDRLYFFFFVAYVRAFRDLLFSTDLINFALLYNFTSWFCYSTLKNILKFINTDDFIFSESFCSCLFTIVTHFF